ncbi:MAG: 16S rRNA processing protein RimM [FCB group bacterium]|nr:16S rRNA processing protein RimM [FCB group bacterium]
MSLGVIIKPHGLKGEVKISLNDQVADAISNDVKIWVRDTAGDVHGVVIETSQFSGPHPRLKLKGVSSREEAEKLRNYELLTDRTFFPEPDESEYFLADLIGLQVWDEHNKYLGDIGDVYALPANDVIALDYAGKEVLIPMIDEIVKLIDFEKNRVIIHPMEGLLDL